MPATIEAYRSEDLDALYRIALATGEAGGDASHLHHDPRLVGHIYAAPYAVLSPATALVARDEAGVGGYIVGAADSRAFEAAAEAAWWPTLRPLYRDPSGTDHQTWSADERRSWQIHHPPRAPSALVGDYPSHLHINLAPRLQGQGLGRRLIGAWLGIVKAMGSPGAHLGVSAANVRALGFYRALGLIEPELPRPPAPGVVWLATRLG